MNCRYEGCEKPTTSKTSNLCNTHYNKEWRAANPEKHRASRKAWAQRNKDKVAVTAKNWREKNKEHVNAYSRQYMAKNAKNEVLQEHMTDSVKKRFFAKVDKTDTCWIWTGARAGYRSKRRLADATQGYGVFTINNRPFYAHRLSWLMHKGELTPGLVIDHICNNSLCVNPDHLQHITNMENISRSERFTGNGAKYRWHKEFCKNGHPRGIELKYKPCPECHKNRNK